MVADPPPRSIRHEFFTRIVGVVVLMTFLLACVIAVNEWKNQKRLLLSRGEQLARYVATLSVDPLITNDVVELDSIVAEGKVDREILYIVVRDEEGRGVTTRHATLNYGSPTIRGLLPELDRVDDVDELLSRVASSGSLSVTAPIVTGDQWIGSVEVGLDRGTIRSNIIRTIGWIVAGNIAAALFLSAVMMSVARRFLFRPLSQLVDAVERMGAGERQVRIKGFRNDEFGIVMSRFNTMVERIEETTVSKGFFEGILNSTREAIVIVSTEGRIIELNPSAAALLGHSRESLLGEPIHSFIPEELSKGCGCGGEITCAGWEMTLPRDGEEGIDVLVSCSPLLHEGEPATVITFVDVTPLKRAMRMIESMNESLRREIGQRIVAEEEARSLNEDLIRQTTALRQSNESLESFCYSISHDLRAPLRHINAFTSIIGEEYGDRLGKEGNRLLQKVIDASNRMGRMIDDLLSYSRVARMDLMRTDVDLSSLCREIIAMFAETDAGRQIRVTVTEGMRVYADQPMMRLVMQNLIGNAWKYTATTPDPMIEIGVTMLEGEEVFFVRDNGAGFDMAYADKLFGVFQRLHGPEYEGSGIGLASVRKIIERHGGRVWGTGTPGEGATFFFTLPG